MPKNKALCVEDLRHAEYYEMQNIFDDLYAKSKNGDIFTNLTNIILSRENILLAYRNIKANAGSKTAGTDGTTTVSYTHLRLCIGRFSILPLLLRRFQEAPAPSKAGKNGTGK